MSFSWHFYGLLHLQLTLTYRGADFTLYSVNRRGMERSVVMCCETTEKSTETTFGIPLSN